MAMYCLPPVKSGQDWLAVKKEKIEPAIIPRPRGRTDFRPRDT